MKTATGLGLLATGAILAFALRASPPGVDIHVVGWILMLAALAGLLAPAQNRSCGQPSPAGRPGTATALRDEEHLPYPPYVLRDPAALASAILRDAELSGRAAPDGDRPATRPFLRAVTEDDVARG
jgi:hypothetical protein